MKFDMKGSTSQQLYKLGVIYGHEKFKLTADIPFKFNVRYGCIEAFYHINGEDHQVFKVYSREDAHEIIGSIPLGVSATDLLREVSERLNAIGMRAEKIYDDQAEVNRNKAIAIYGPSDIKRKKETLGITRTDFISLASWPGFLKKSLPDGVEPYDTKQGNHSNFSVNFGYRDPDYKMLSPIFSLSFINGRVDTESLIPEEPARIIFVENIYNVMSEMRREIVENPRLARVLESLNAVELRSRDAVTDTIRRLYEGKEFQGGDSHMHYQKLMAAMKPREPSFNYEEEKVSLGNGLSAILSKSKRNKRSHHIEEIRFEDQQFWGRDGYLKELPGGQESIASVIALICERRPEMMLTYDKARYHENVSQKVSKRDLEEVFDKLINNDEIPDRFDTADHDETLMIEI